MHITANLKKQTGTVVSRARVPPVIRREEGYVLLPVIAKSQYITDPLCVNGLFYVKN